MASEPVSALDRAVQGVADGAPIDWDDLEQDAADAEERECLQWLRVLDRIGDLHESTDDVPEAGGTASASSVEAPALETWGKYVLVERIGQGGFGSVYRARDRELDFELAIKILHQRAGDARLRQKLIDEGKALAKVTHRNVVRVLTVESDGDRVGLCMEFVRGQTLEDLLASAGPFSASEAVLIGIDVCGALAAVHRAGFLHRDVKARNVVREQGGRNVLMDFGAGRMLSSSQPRAGDLTGTPLYMAPELLAGAPASAASDVYSVGVMLYHLVTAEYPVQASTVDDLRRAHREGDRRFLSERRPDLPVRFVAVVERMLSSDPKERFATAGAAADALSLVLRNEAEKKEHIADALSKLFQATYVVLGGAAAFLALGIFTSRTFNRALGRAGFAHETISEWVVWGAQSAVLPVLLVLAALVLASHVVMLQRFAVRRSASAYSRWETVRERVRGAARRLGLDDVPALSTYVLVSSSAALGGAIWYFYPLLYACLDLAATAPASQLALLAPDQVGYADGFRETFTFVILLASIGWLAVGRMASQIGRTIDRAVLTAGIGVIVVATMVLSAPYRLLRHAQFEVVRWDRHECYAIGDRGADALLFCPDLSPRNRVVGRDAGIERLGRTESVFSRFAGAAGGQASTHAR